MKYFIIISISLLLAVPAHAAKTVKGTVPVAVPFQTADPNSHPNLSSNIQATAPAERSVGQPNNFQPAIGQGSQAPAAQAPATSGVSKSAGNFWVWLVVLLLMAAAIFWWAWSRKRVP